MLIVAGGNPRPLVRALVYVSVDVSWHRIRSQMQFTNKCFSVTSAREWTASLVLGGNGNFKTWFNLIYLRKTATQGLKQHSKSLPTPKFYCIWKTNPPISNDFENFNSPLSKHRLPKAINNIQSL